MFNKVVNNLLNAWVFVFKFVIDHVFTNHSTVLLSHYGKDISDSQLKTYFHGANHAIFSAMIITSSNSIINNIDLSESDKVLFNKVFIEELEETLDNRIKANFNYHIDLPYFGTCIICSQEQELSNAGDCYLCFKVDTLQKLATTKP